MKTENKKINLKHLPTKYGITETILQDLMKYDIMFPIEMRTKPNGKVDLFVKVDDILLLINRMLENQMAVYKLVEEANEAAKTIEEIYKTAPTLSDLAKQEAGENNG